MGLFFSDPLHEDFAATLALGQVSHGGAEPGEIIATCALITDGDDGSWYENWCATADSVAATAESSAVAGRNVSAREAFWRAAVYYGLSFHPLFGRPVDPRLTEAFARQRSAFERGNALLDRPPEPLAVPLDGATIPGWFFSAGDGVRPVLVCTNGYDAGMPEQFLAGVLPALRRGYHAVVFDGPGQGRMLVEQQVPMRADWENVIGPVLDQVLARPDVDAARVALMGWSLGGYLALRAASAEHRLAACVADPGLYGIPEGFQARLRAAGVAEDVIAAYPELPADILAFLGQMIDGDRNMRWSLKQRGFWVHGVGDIAGYLKATVDFTLAGRLGGVTCPVLVLAAESDPLSASAPQVQAEITGPSSLVRFTAREGAGDHCEWRNRLRFDQVAFDWLGGILEPRQR
jgi:alpha-beta hydrolase superfamily lysophospholipase